MIRFLLAILLFGSIQAMDKSVEKQNKFFDYLEPKLILLNKMVSVASGIGLIADLFYWQSGYLVLPCAIEGSISLFNYYLLNKQRKLLKELNKPRGFSFKEKVIAMHHQAEAGKTVNGAIPMLSIFFATNNFQAKLSSIPDECKKEKSWSIPTAIGLWHTINYGIIQKNQTSINTKYDKLPIFES